MSEVNGDAETRQERREKKLLSRRARMPQHGKRLAQVYRNAILKRAKKAKEAGTSINNSLLYAGSVLTVVWGIAHIVPTKSVVNGFGAISGDNRKIITMEWIAEGLALVLSACSKVIVLLSTAISPMSNNV